MNAEANPVTEVLERTSKGKGTFQELASSLKNLDNMAVIIPPADFTRFMEDLETARKERERKVAAGELPASEIHVKMTDVENPKLNGIQTQNGFVPRVFTSDQIAREFAVTSGLIEPDANLPFLTKDWVSGFQEFLFNGYVGIVIDDGSPHKVNLDRSSIARVFAYMTFEEFAKLPVLHAVTLQGKLLFQPSSSGGYQAFVYDNPKAAAYGLSQIQKSAAGAGSQEIPTGSLLTQILGAGVTVLVVNHAVPDTRLYNRDELVKMVELCGGTNRAEKNPAPPTESAPIPDPALNPQTGQAGGTTSETANDIPQSLKRALARPTLPMIPAPEQSDVDAQMLFHEWRNKAGQKTVEVYELLEALAYQIKFYALVHPRPVDGLTSAPVFRSPDNENETITYLYTSEEVVHKVLENDPPELRRYNRLSGIEALRWIWSAPKSIDSVAIDYYPNSPSWLSVPTYWVLSAVYPHFCEVADLKKVPNAGLANLGGLPGARGLKPEAVRALVFGWKQLMGLEIQQGAQPTIDHEGKRFLPIFSDADQFLAFTSSPKGVQGKPKPFSGREAPFAGWLGATVDCGGVVLDPAGPHPLTLDHSDLLVLNLWAENPGMGPDGWKLINAIARLYYEKKISATLAGRLLADHPRYWAGLSQTPDGGGALLMVPKSDACALFTSQDLAQKYIDFLKSLENAAAQMEGMQPIPVLTRWHTSALAIASEQFTEIAINPDPYGTEGLFLGRDALDAALERIDEKLKPRVPGFIAEA